MPRNTPDPNQYSLLLENPHSGELHVNPEAVGDLHEPQPYTEGDSVDLNARDLALIGVMDKIAEARSERGLVEASSPSQPANRLRLVRAEMRKHGLNARQAEAKVSARAQEAGKNAKALDSKARGIFDETTGIPATIEKGVEEIDGIDPEVLIISYFSNFMDKIKTQKDLAKLRERHSRNFDVRNKTN